MQLKNKLLILWLAFKNLFRKRGSYKQLQKKIEDAHYLAMDAIQSYQIESERLSELAEQAKESTPYTDEGMSWALDLMSDIVAEPIASLHDTLYKLRYEIAVLDYVEYCWIIATQAVCYTELHACGERVFEYNVALIEEEVLRTTPQEVLSRQYLNVPPIDE